MEREEITVRIRRYREIAKNSSKHGIFSAQIHNTCMNRLSVLEVMLERFDFHEWYDEESNFRIAYQNTVEELIEAD